MGKTDKKNVIKKILAIQKISENSKKPALTREDLIKRLGKVKVEQCEKELEIDSLVGISKMKTSNLSNQQFLGAQKLQLALGSANFAKPQLSFQAGKPAPDIPLDNTHSVAFTFDFDDASQQTISFKSYTLKLQNPPLDSDFYGKSVLIMVLSFIAFVGSYFLIGFGVLQAIVDSSILFMLFFVALYLLIIFAIIKRRKGVLDSDEESPSTFGLPKGLVRGLLSIMLSYVIVVELFKTDFQIPSHLLLIFTVVLAFYGYEKLLPKSMQVSIPSDFGTISRIPPINDGLNQIIATLDGLRNQLVIFKDANYQFWTRTDDQIQRVRDDFNCKIDGISELMKKYNATSSNLIEQLGIIVLLGVLALICAYNYMRSPNDVPLDLVIGPLAGIVSVVAGLDVSLGVTHRTKKYFNHAFDELLWLVLELRAISSKTIDDIIESLDLIKNDLDEVKKKNILEFLPPHIVGGVVLAVMSLIGSMFFLNIPGATTVSISSICLVIMEIVVGFYFITKK